jgi:hypothetical protein
MRASRRPRSPSPGHGGVVAEDRARGLRRLTSTGYRGSNCSLAKACSLSRRAISAPALTVDEVEQRA